MMDYLRGSSDKIGTIQRRLTWPLRKDDTHKSRSVPSPAKLPVSYPFFPILALHHFWPLRLLPPASVNYLICFLQFFWPEIQEQREPHLGPSLGLRSCSSFLRPANSVAWRVHVGSWQFVQGGRLWLSPPTEEVWRPKHVGQRPPSMATFGESARNQKAWLVSALWERRALFTNRSNRPGDDVKDELRTDGDPMAWQAWRTAQNQLWQLRQPAPPLEEFPGEQGMYINMYAQVREEEQVISSQFTRNQQDVSMRRRKKRKQVEDGALTV